MSRKFKSTSRSFNKHFLTAITTKDLQIFKHNEETGEIKNSYDIVEHANRLLEISEDHHFYMDEDAFKAFGSNGFPQRFTRVFVDESKVEFFPKSLFYRVHSLKEIKKSVEIKDFYAPDTKIFFIGNANFLKTCSEFSNKLLLTVVDKTSENQNIKDEHKLPLEDLKIHFSKRKDIEPEMLQMIKEYKKKMIKKLEEKVEIADNGMRIIRTDQEQDKLLDPILDTPEYFFYEYTR